MTATPDRDLLAGMLALKVGFVTAEQLILAMNAWATRKSAPLEQILLEQSHLDSKSCQLLQQLVERHLHLHQHDVARSLRSLEPMLPEAYDQLTNSIHSQFASTLQRFSSEDADLTPPMAIGGVADVGEAASQGQRFRFLRPHARGGLGEVSVALDVDLNREVALKQIQSRLAQDPECRSRFLREAQITGALEHPGIVPVYALGLYADGRPYYAMRFIRGESMKVSIDTLHEKFPGADFSRSLEFRQLLHRLVDVCNAIEYAHSRGVIHRDLKPANIMLGKFGETLVVDWGLAKTREREQPMAEDGPSLDDVEDVARTQAGTAVGTPAYMSPEQAAGRADQLGPASDIYSLGATLYTLLTGKPPFSGDSENPLWKVQRGEFQRPREVRAGVPRALDAICCHAMSLRADSRYVSARDLADDLERYLADEPVRVHREAVHERAGRWFRKHRSLALASMISLALIATVSSVAAAVVHRQKQRIEALAIAESEARDWSERHLDVAQYVLDSLGELALSVRDIPAATDAQQGSPLSNAVDIYQQFLAENPRTSRPHILAKAFGNLGMLQVALFDDQAAEQSYRQSIAAYEDLLKIETEDPQLTEQLTEQLMVSYGNLAGLLQRNMRPETWAMHNQIIEQQSKLAQTYPENITHQRMLARAHLNRGLHITQIRGLQLVGRDVSAFIPAPVDLQTAALDDLRKACLRFAELAEQHPQRVDLLAEMAKAKNSYALAWAGSTAPNPGDSAIANAAKMLQATVIMSDVRNMQLDLISRLEAALSQHGQHVALIDVLLQARVIHSQLLVGNDMAGAEQSLRLAEDEATQLALRFPTADNRARLAEILYSRGVLHNLRNEWTQAIAALDAALDIQQPLVDAFPDRPIYAAAAVASLTNRGQAHLASGAPQVAQDSVQRAVNLAQRVVREYPQHIALREHLRTTYVGAVQTMRATGDHRALVAVAEGHQQLPSENGLQAYEAAQLIALAIDLVDQDQKLATAEQSATIEAYAARAVELLERAFEAGYRPGTPAAQEPDFQRLHSRDDFQALLRRYSL